MAGRMEPPPTVEASQSEAEDHERSADRGNSSSIGRIPLLPTLSTISSFSSLSSLSSMSSFSSTSLVEYLPASIADLRPAKLIDATACTPASTVTLRRLLPEPPTKRRTSISASAPLHTDLPSTDRTRRSVAPVARNVVRVFVLAAFVMVALVLAVASGRFLLAVPTYLGAGPTPYAHRMTIPNSYCVPGGGFGGFFYLLGQLKSMEEQQTVVQTVARTVAPSSCTPGDALSCQQPDNYNHNSTRAFAESAGKSAYLDLPQMASSHYSGNGSSEEPHGKVHQSTSTGSKPRLVCYSAACLAIVAVEQGWSTDRIYNAAKDSQQRWATGELTTSEILRAFIDDLLADIDPTGPPPAWLSRMVVVTTASSSSRSSDTKPTQDTHKRSFLSKARAALASTIPASSLLRSIVELGTSGPVLNTPTDYHSLRRLLIQSAWIVGVTGDGMWHDGHMDGGFSTMAHPKCTGYVLPGWDWSLVRYIFDPAMEESEAFRLVEAGRAYGIPMP